MFSLLVGKQLPMKLTTGCCLRLCCMYLPLVPRFLYCYKFSGEFLLLNCGYYSIYSKMVP